MGVALVSAGSAVIVGILTLIGVLVSNNAHDAVIDAKIDELTREVREHNDFARRVPVLESNITTLFKETKEIRERIDK